MEDQLTLIASQSTFEDQIAKIDGYLGQLEGVLGEYQSLKASSNNFMQGTDSNYENLQRSIDINIDAVKRAIALSQDAKKRLQKTVEEMSNASSNIGNLLNQAAETAKSGVETAIRLEMLGL